MIPHETFHPFYPECQTCRCQTSKSPVSLARDEASLAVPLYLIPTRGIRSVDGKKPSIPITEDTGTPYMSGCSSWVSSRSAFYRFAPTIGSLSSSQTFTNPNRHHSIFSINCVCSTLKYLALVVKTQRENWAFTLILPAPEPTSYRASNCLMNAVSSLAALPCAGAPGCLLAPTVSAVVLGSWKTETNLSPDILTYPSTAR